MFSQFSEPDIRHITGNDTIESVYLTGYNYVPEEFKGHKEIKNIYLNNCRISYFPTWISTIDSLKLIILKDCSITPLNLSEIRNLDHLHIINSDLNFTNYCGKLKLKSIKISQKYPTGLSDIGSIESLILLKLDLDSTGWKEDLKKFIYLKSLELILTSIKVLPPEISNLKNLERLTVGGGAFMEITPEFLTLPKLRKLSICATSISEIPEFIANIDLLESIQFADNLQLDKDDYERLIASTIPKVTIDTYGFRYSR